MESIIGYHKQSWNNSLNAGFKRQCKGLAVKMERSCEELREPEDEGENVVRREVWMGHALYFDLEGSCLLQVVPGGTPSFITPSFAETMGMVEKCI